MAISVTFEKYVKSRTLQLACLLVRTAVFAVSLLRTARTISAQSLP